MTDKKSINQNRREMLMRLAGVTLLGSATLVTGRLEAGGHTMPESIGYPPVIPSCMRR